MARRSNAARLPEGMTLLDFASPAAIMRAFQGDEKRIRAEYSRQRSIVRKRVERMQAAGETDNFVFRKYGDLQQALPVANKLTTRQMMEILTNTGSTIAGGYQSTLSDIRQRRRKLKKTIAEAQQQQREKAKRKKGAAAADEDGGDEGEALTDAQVKKIQQLMGMTQFVLGKAQDSDTILEEATKIVKRGGKQRNLLTMAAEILTRFDADVEDLEGLRSRFTAKGTTRVSWAKAHKGRGK